MTTSEDDLRGNPSKDQLIGHLTDRVNELEQQVEHLESSLANARTIGTALGILMSNDKITSDQAFGQLVTASQWRNTKLHRIATEVVESGHL